MSEASFTRVEERAIAALSLPAFPINLRDIRDNVRSVLSEVQRYGFFNEYTSHSFDHVRGMLETVEWIIPEKTKESLTAADWLMITLAIYFHDVGLLISRDEFSKRDRNGDFARYLTELPQSTDDYKNYISKLNELSEDERDRVIYQEFVRSSHGSRVRAWIEGVATDDDDASSEIRGIIKDLLGRLDPTIRKDLAALCESHTVDDFSDVFKYKLSRPYGDSAQEAANLQYAAVILRTVDLLQITKRRAPSALFRIVNPTDPISQIEWQKQGAVRTVRPTPGKDKEGNASASNISDTIEVHAQFAKAEGFFGLTSYLSYVRTELHKCFEAVQKSASQISNPPLFPWRYIDDTGVEADGFLTKAYGFELDQEKILDLLTGHTLYNNTKVVIRELTQNALDAVRLQCEIDKVPTESHGRIGISWNSSSRSLEIVDNGTGMSQAVIEDHLLTVGSSRYQDPQFQEKYPNFTSISRFGIGVLSAFMVADSVEITTCSPDDLKARRISLRSVHGKYLIKLLDKVSDRAEIGVYPHGSKVRLTLRPTAHIGDVLEITRNWIIIPGCAVYVKIDGSDPSKVGFDSPKAALEHQIATLPSLSSIDQSEHEVRQFSLNGITLAYAVTRDDLFRDWGFVELSEREEYEEDEDDAQVLVATCVEGVGVDYASPGFRGKAILSLANATGKLAPKTNVARSALEDTPEYRDMLRVVYRLYARHVDEEIGRLSKTSDYSMSRAVEQAPYLASPLISGRHSLLKANLLQEAFSNIPLIIIESASQRNNISPNQLNAKSHFWTVYSPLIESVEFFVREAPKDISASMILEKLEDNSSSLPGEMTVCNLSSSRYIESNIRRTYEPSEVVANAPARRLSLKWAKIGNSPRWISSQEIFRDVSQSDRKLWSTIQRNREMGGLRRNARMLLPLADIDVSGLEGAGSFEIRNDYYFVPGDPLTNFLQKNFLTSRPERKKAVCAYLLIFDSVRKYGRFREHFSVEMLERIIEGESLHGFRSVINSTDFITALREGSAKTFNPFAWRRRGADHDTE